MTRFTRWMMAGFALAWLAGLAAYPLLESTEGRYASVAWTMAHGGSWIEPMFNGVPLFTKPPLAYWTGAGALKALPDTAWAVRLPASVMLLLCAWLTRRLALVMALDNRRAGWAAIIAFLSPLAVVQGHMTTGDIFLWTGVLVAFVGALDDSLGTLRRAVIVGLGLAIGFLAKGHMVLFWVVLPLGGWLVLAAGERHRWRSLVHPVSWLVFAGLAVPWFAVVVHRHPELQAYWLGSEIGDRFLTTTHGRAEPWWYFLPMVPLLLLPWLAEFWRGLRRGLVRPEYRTLLLVWVLLPLIAFTLAGSKRPNYLLPMTTPLALIAAQGWPDRTGRWLNARTGGWAMIVLAWPLVMGLGHLGPPTQYLVAMAVAAHRPLAAYGTEPSSLVFYNRGDVPVAAVVRESPLRDESAPPACDVGCLRAHLAAGGWVLLRRTDLAGIRKRIKHPLTVKTERGRYVLVAGVN